jgi:hypothetical protein
MQVEHEAFFDSFRRENRMSGEELSCLTASIRRELGMDVTNPLTRLLFHVSEISGTCSTHWGDTIVLVPDIEHKAIREQGVRTFDCAVIASGAVERFIRPITQWDYEGGEERLPRVEGEEPTHLLCVGQGEGVQTYLLHLEPYDIRPIDDED